MQSEFQFMTPLGRDRVRLPQVAWKAASQRTEQLDTTKEVAISSTDRKQWMDNFTKKHGFSLPASRTPHDTTLGMIKRQLDSEQLQYVPLTKVKIFGEVTKPKTVDLSVNGQKVVSAESEEEPLKAHTFIRNLSVLMNAYALSNVISYQVAIDHTTFFEDKVFPQLQNDRVPLIQAMSADEELRRHWMATVRTKGKTLAQAIEESRPMQLSLMTAPRHVAAPQVPGPPRNSTGSKREQPLGPKIHKYPRMDSGKPWNYSDPTSGKQICFNWNSGTCAKSETDCGRKHICAVCFKADCRAPTHQGYFRPSVGGKGGKAGKGR